MYDLGDRLLMVASDRISTYDVVHPNPIPDKGKVLTGISAFWFAKTGHIVPNHFVLRHRRRARRGPRAARSSRAS
jgi:phosphoribosylaminoimidazole-succinocarboxamide synthase